MLRIHAWNEDEEALNSDDDLGVAKVVVASILMARGNIYKVELLNEDNVGTSACATIYYNVRNLENAF